MVRGKRCRFAIFSHSRPIIRRFVPPSSDKEGLTGGGCDGKLFLHIESPITCPYGAPSSGRGLTDGGFAALQKGAERVLL